MTPHNAHQDALFDHLDATGQFTAQEIRDEIGDSTTSNEDFTADAILARHPEYAFIGDAVEEDPADVVGTPDDLRHYDINKKAWAENMADPQRARAKHAGIIACRKAIQDNRQD